MVSCNFVSRFVQNEDEILKRTTLQWKVKIKIKLGSVSRSIKMHASMHVHTSPPTQTFEHIKDKQAHVPISLDVRAQALRCFQK